MIDGMEHEAQGFDDGRADALDGRECPFTEEDMWLSGTPELCAYVRGYLDGYFTRD